MAHALGEVAGVVGVDLRLVRGARDGDVGKAGADELRVGPRVHVDEYSLGGDSLGAVGCDGVAMVEVPMRAVSKVMGCSFPSILTVSWRPSRFWIVPRSRLATPSSRAGAVN